ncbi:MAG TPA: ricin-type beta-trefoil lectin domain protein [Candidatus Lumbricidophila sp.]|nr:ricin-type beta-trefoil lectin domain protein [Candidatus Lumbricidophila sp.]
MGRQLLRVIASLTLATAVAAGALVGADAARADGAGSGQPWAVTLGDSFISGEAGRWAGNTSGTEQARIDALGSTAYFDNGPHIAETIERCHRSQSAPAYFGGSRIAGLNLACSGATTSTSWDGSQFKPGIDFADDGAGHLGQALMLKQFAATHNVTMVVLSIGGNDFGFGTIVQNCVIDFLTSPASRPDFCLDDYTTTSRLNPTHAQAVRAKVKQAILNVDQAMAQAGYGRGQWSLVVADYPSPVERSTEARYGDTGYAPQSTGGCGFWKADLDFANDVMVPMINSTIWAAADDAVAAGVSNLHRLELEHVLDNHKLCQRGVDLADSIGYTNPWAPDAQNSLEWVNQVHTAQTVGTDFFIQESLHPNYWGQLAMRNCLRQVWNDGMVRGGACQPSYDWGKNAFGEPNVTYAPTYAAGYQPPRRLFNIGGQASHRCVDVPGDSAAAGTALGLWDCNGGANQNFTYDRASKHIQGFGANQGGKCIGLQNNSGGWGTRIVTQACDGSNALQRWNLGADRQIVNDATGLCLDANGGGTSNGTALIVWGCGGQQNQKWWY